MVIERSVQVQVLKSSLILMMKLLERCFSQALQTLLMLCESALNLSLVAVQGKTVGGGVGLASATDYCMASKFGAIKLSELNVGIGPFVVGPAVQRKLSLSGMSQIAIDANSFYSAEWAKDKGLYTQVLESNEELDAAVQSFAEHLANYNPEAMREMKSMFWTGTENWDKLLAERAAISGRLVLSEFTKETLKRFK